MTLKSNKSFLSVIGVVLVLFLISTFFINENSLSEEELLIEEINFSADSSKNMNPIFIFVWAQPYLTKYMLVMNRLEKWALPLMVANRSI